MAEETTTTTEESPLSEYGNVYQMWIQIHNHSTGEVKIEIRQYGKPPGDPPPPGGG